ncbi:MAG: hypothetical protein ACI4TZ_03765 [Christensenellales bacterium]
MIEFSGILSNSCKKYLINRAKKISFVGLVCPCILLLIPFIFLTLKNSVFIIAVIMLLLLPFLSFIQLPKSSLDLIFPNTIIINNDIITTKGKNFRYSKPISSIKKIIDYGDWYHIFFYYKDRCENFVCQKDLIKSGTIEEFEKLFKGKIIKKIK